MSDTARHIQSGFTAVTPYLYGTIELIDFVKGAFSAEVMRIPTPDAKGHFHAEAKIGGVPIMFGNGYFADPSMSAAVYVYVPDVDATYKKALSLGAKSLREPRDETWGDRVGGVKDMSGNSWWIATFKGTK